MAEPNPLRCRICGRASTARDGAFCTCTGRPVEKIDLRIQQLLAAVLLPAAPILRIFIPNFEGGDQ